MSLSIAQLILSYRKKHNLTQEQMAKLIKATQPQICQWERGVHCPYEFRQADIRKRLCSNS